LSEPFVPSRASLRARGPTGPEAGRTVFPNVLSEVEGQAHGSGRTVFPNVLSEVEGSAQDERFFPDHGEPVEPYPYR